MARELGDKLFAIYGPTEDKCGEQPTSISSIPRRGEKTNEQRLAELLEIDPKNITQNGKIHGRDFGGSNNGKEPSIVIEAPQRQSSRSRKKHSRKKRQQSLPHKQNDIW